MAVWDSPDQQMQHFLYLLSSTFVSIPSIFLFVFDIFPPWSPSLCWGSSNMSTGGQNHVCLLLETDDASSSSAENTFLQM